MLEEKDIQKLIEAQKEIFVTKDDLEGLIEIVATKKEIEDLREEMRDGFNKLKDQEINPLKERVRKAENALAIE